jgi:dihydroorotase
VAAVTRDRAGEELTEMGDLVEAGAVAFSDDGDPVKSAEILRHAMEYSKMFDVPIIEHCEEKSLTQGGGMHEGALSTRLGMKGMPGIAEDIIVNRDILVAEYVGARLHIAHISTAASVDLVRKAKERGVQVTCEVMTHHFTLSDQAVVNYDTNAKMSPPLRSQTDVEAMIEGLKDGTIEVIATDHAPHSIEEKQVEFDAAPFGIIGLETALGLVMTQLVKPGILTLPEAIAKMTRYPAEILRLDRGAFKTGAPASISILDLEADWTVDKEQFKSKSRNTPFDGWQLQGKVFGLYNRGLWWQA